MYLRDPSLHPYRNLRRYEQRKYMCGLVTYPKSGHEKNILPSHPLQINPMTVADVILSLSVHLTVDATASSHHSGSRKRAQRTKRGCALPRVLGVGERPAGHWPTTRKWCFCKTIVISTKATWPADGQSSVHWITFTFVYPLVYFPEAWENPPFFPGHLVRTGSCNLISHFEEIVFYNHGKS